MRWVQAALGLLLLFTPVVSTADAQADYSIFCAMCHGDTGMADGIRSPTLNPPASNFSICDYRFDANGDEATGGDEDLFLVIRDGGFAYGGSVEMASYGALFTDQEIGELVGLIRTFEDPIACPEPGSALAALAALGTIGLARRRRRGSAS